jgi:hypothetical protein
LTAKKALNSHKFSSDFLICNSKTSSLIIVYILC